MRSYGVDHEIGGPLWTGFLLGGLFLIGMAIMWRIAGHPWSPVLGAGSAGLYGVIRATWAWARDGMETSAS